MLAIRFNRAGKKNRSTYRIVLQEHTVAPGGRHVAVLGSHDPHLKKTILNTERIKYWISKGAQASDSVWNLLILNKVVEGYKRAVKIPKAVPAEQPAVEAAPAEAPKDEAKVEETKAEEKPAEGGENK